MEIKSIVRMPILAFLEILFILAENDEGSSLNKKSGQFKWGDTIVTF